MSKRWIFVGAVVVAATLLRVAWGLRSPSPKVAPAVPLPELLALIDDEMAFRIDDAPAERNAWNGMMEAASRVSRLPMNHSQILDQVLLRPESLATPSTLVDLEEVFQHHRETMELAKKAIVLPECSAGEMEAGVNPVPNLRGLQSLVTLLCRRGILALHRGSVDAAIDDLTAAFRIGERLGESGGPLFYASLASGLLARAERDIRGAAMSPNMTQEGLAKLADALPRQGKLEVDFKRSLRSEFYWFVRHEVMRLSGPGGNSLGNEHSSESARDIDTGWHEVDEIASIVLEDHSEPYDRKETVRSAVPIYRNLLANTDLPWSKRLAVDREISLLVADWPRPALSGDSTGAPHVQDAIRKGHDGIIKSKNPYGRLALWYFIPVSDQAQATPFRNRADLEATRTLLALRRFELKNGKLPPSLETLCQHKLLDRVPLDPFGEGPIRYDSARRRIWSAGRDGIDGGGKGNGTVSLISDDLVWTMELGKRIQLPPPVAVKEGLAKKLRSSMVVRAGSSRPFTRVSRQ